MADDQVVSNGIKLLGEAFVIPGSSLILEGRVGAGLLHGALGIAATALLGPLAPIGRVLIAANSYTRSLNDRNIWEVRSGSPVGTGETHPGARPKTP